MPEEYEAIFRMLLNRVPNADKAIFSVHCHNDLGLAVANTLAGLAGGARQIECTINGIGERAGNAALEEVVMALRTRADVLPYANNIETTMLTRASKLVSGVTSFPVQYNKAIVGRNAFAHESGIHQDGMLKNAQTYEIMTPESVGVSKTSLVMGKHSGRHAFREKLKELGYTLGDNQLKDAFKRFKDLADRKKIVYDEDIEALVDDQMGHQGERIRVEALTVIAGTMGPQTATLTLVIDGQHLTRQAVGNGPVDAIFNAIKGARPPRRDARTLSGARRHRGHRRAGGSLRAAVRERPLGDRARRRPRHDGRLRPRLCGGAGKAHRQAAQGQAGAHGGGRHALSGRDCPTVSAQGRPRAAFFVPGPPAL